MQANSDDQPPKPQDQDDDFVVVNNKQADNEPKPASKGKEVRLIREEIQLEDDEDDDDQDGEEIEGDMDDLLAGLPDDTEASETGTYYCMLIGLLRRSISSTRV